MKKTRHTAQLNELFKKPFFTASEARFLGVPSRILSHYCLRGILDRVNRGVYRVNGVDSGLDIALEDLVMTVSTIPHGIICLISALCYYELTDQNMREYWIAVPNRDKSPKRLHIRAVRMRNTLLGQTTVNISGYEVKIFDRERTVIDSFRYLSHEIAIKALRIYLNATPRHKPDLQKLSSYAKILKVNITPYIMALTT